MSRRVEDVRAAYMLVRESYSMASGPEEEERVLDLRLARGRRVGVVEGVFTVKHDLELRGVRELVVEGRSFGSVFGWLLWAVSCLAVAAIVWALLSGSVPAVYSAALTVAVLVGLLRM